MKKEKNEVITKNAENTIGLIQDMTDEQENNYYSCMYHLKSLLTINKNTTNDILPVVNDGIEGIEDLVDTLRYVNGEIDRYIYEISTLIEGK